MKLPGVYPYFHWMEEDKYQTCWITSDTHFGDEELRAGIPARPSDEEIFRRLKSKVGKNDVLIHLGDVGNLDYIKKLKGYKILIMGNHDTGRTKYERKEKVHRFDDLVFSTKAEVMAEMEKRYPGWNITVLGAKEYSFHKPFVSWVVIADNNLFDEVYEGPLMLGEKLILSHEPFNHPFIYNVHGHRHEDTGVPCKSHLNVCLDACNYEPLNLNTALKKGLTSNVYSLHRYTIDAATARKEK